MRCAGRRLLRLAATSRQRPRLSLLATAADGLSCSARAAKPSVAAESAAEDGVRYHKHAENTQHTAAWLSRHDVGGQKGQMGIFANVTVVADQSRRV